MQRREASLDTKICFICRAEQDELIRVSNEQLVFDICASCISARTKNSKKIPKKYTNKYLNKEYGISLEDYDKLKKQQKDLCAVCQDIATNPHSLVVDGGPNKIYGLLCSSCYLVMGILGKSPTSVIGAIKYLEAANINHSMRQISLLVEDGHDIIISANGFANWELLASLYRAIEKVENPFLNHIDDLEEEEEEEE